MSGGVFPRVRSVNRLRIRFAESEPVAEQTVLLVNGSGNTREQAECAVEPSA